MRLRFICGGLLALTMLSSTELNAQEDRHAVADTDSSVSFFPEYNQQYNVVEDHPDCNAPDQIAFTVSLQRNFIEQFIFDPVDQSSVLISHELLTPSTEAANELSSGHTIIQKLAVEARVEEVEVCTVRTRRGAGGEVSEIQIPCLDEPAEKITQTGFETTWIARLASATLSTEGAITICMSPTKIEILEVTGHINGTYTQVNDSTSALPSDTQDLGMEIHNSSSFDEIGLSASFFHMAGARNTLGDRNEIDLSGIGTDELFSCLLYTSPSPRDRG